MSTCRLCKGYDGEMIQYSVRHYAHAECAFKKWGADFLQMIHPWQAKYQVPYMSAVKAGFKKELEERAAQSED